MNQLVQQQFKSATGGRRKLKTVPKAPGSKPTSTGGDSDSTNPFEVITEIYGAVGEAGEDDGEPYEEEHPVVNALNHIDPIIWRTFWATK